MILDANSQDKPEISYPCSWNYTVIGTDGVLIEEAVLTILGGRECSFETSKTSKGGKYCSYKLEILVHNEDERNLIFEEIKKHKHVKMVL